MFSTKPKRLTLTLLFTITLALALTSFSEAKGYAAVDVHRRGHGNIGRMLKKRIPATADTPATDDETVPVAANPNVEGVGAIPPTISVSSAPTVPSTSTSQSVSVSVSSSVSLSSSAASSTITSSSAVSSSVSSSALNSTSSAASSTTALTQAPATPTTASLDLVPGASAPITITYTSSSFLPTATTATQLESASENDHHTTSTVLIVIGASIAGAAIIWTIIRKWKFKPSSHFEDRMQPINWQPTNPEDDALPGGHRRIGSGGSSFHSGIGHDANLGGGYGATSDSGHGPSPLGPLPNHDFTAGPTHLAPVGGYADLSRGPSPQPQMQEAMPQGLSAGRPTYDQYGVPLHHQTGYTAHDAYNMNGQGY